MTISGRTKWFMVLGVFAVGCSGFAFAQESPQVVLTLPSDPALAQRGVVTFSISNPTDERVAFLSIETPFANEGDHLANIEFKVTDPGGRDLAYRGRNVNFGRPDSSSFVILEPHQTLTKNVDVVREYGLTEGGAYTITYEKAMHVLRGTDARHLDPAKPVDDVPGQATKSNTLTFYVKGALTSSRRNGVRQANHHARTGTARVSSQRMAVGFSAG